MAVRVAGVGHQVNMQENEPHQTQLALSDADALYPRPSRAGFYGTTDKREAMQKFEQRWRPALIEAEAKLPPLTRLIQRNAI